MIICLWLTNNMKNKPQKECVINSYFLEYLKSLLHHNAKIVNLEVYNNYLRATLKTGLFFSVSNNI